MISQCCARRSWSNDEERQGRGELKRASLLFDLLQTKKKGLSCFFRHLSFFSWMMTSKRIFTRTILSYIWWIPFWGIKETAYSALFAFVNQKRKRKNGISTKFVVDRNKSDLFRPSLSLQSNVWLSRRLLLTRLVEHLALMCLSSFSFSLTFRRFLLFFFLSKRIIIYVFVISILPRPLITRSRTRTQESQPGPRATLTLCSIRSMYAKLTKKRKQSRHFEWAKPLMSGASSSHHLILVGSRPPFFFVKRCWIIPPCRHQSCVVFFFLIFFFLLSSFFLKIFSKKKTKKKEEEKRV